MKTLYLYTTLGCHLCEQAESLLLPHLTALNYQLQAVEISDSDQLMDAYGIRIPVIRREDSGAELGWPFDTELLLTFLAD